jgi:hypothetical protein
MWVAKSQAVRPVINKILGVGNSVEVQAAILRAIIDHPKLVSARAIVGAASSSEQAANNYILCQQSARMMGRNMNTRGNISTKRRDAAETMLTMCAPLFSAVVVVIVVVAAAVIVLVVIAQT